MDEMQIVTFIFSSRLRPHYANRWLFNMSTTPIIEFEHVALSFNSFQVHRDLSFRINAGEAVTILGPSGSGKTMILKLIIGLIFSSAGSVKVMGNDPKQLSSDELINYRRGIGMLFQGAALFDSLSVYDNVSYGLHEAKDLSEDEISKIVNEKLEIVGLPGIGLKFPSQLSGGQKKRVGLARALASEPKIMLFDEPTTGLDPSAIRLIDDLIIKLKNDYGMTAIMVTHDIASAKRVSDRFILINNGEITADGPAAKIVLQSEALRSFIEGEWREEN